MSKFVYALVLLTALALAAAAQTRRPAAQTPARAKPAATQTPARRPTPTPAQSTRQQGAANTPAAAAKLEDCGCEAGPLPEVLATVNGIKITLADLSPAAVQRVQAMQQEVVEARKQILGVKINSILLEAEAKKRGVSNQKLFEDEVVSKTVQPTAADAQAYFTQARQQIEQQAGRAVDFNEIKDQIVAYLLNQRQNERSNAFAESLRVASGVKSIPTDVKPPANDAERARVLVTVGGRAITAGEIEEDLRPLVAQTQEQVYLLRKNDVDQRVNDILLSQEAQKRGVTERALLESEISSKVPVVTEAQAQDFYNKNKERISGGGDFTQLKYQIIQFMQSEEQRKLESALVARLRNGATVQTFVTPPPVPVYKIATDDQPSKGNPDAAVTVVEFTDYQCPNCATAQPILERLVAEYGDRVRFVVRDFPLTMHADAQKAAEAAEAAREQGKYWDFTAILFRNQSSLKPEQLKQYAQVIGLDRAKFDAALDSGRFADKVARDVADGERIGVNGTPTFFINGRRASDATYETLKAALDAALKNP